MVEHLNCVESFMTHAICTMSSDAQGPKQTLISFFFFLAKLAPVEW